jgi:hypothetical protein
MTNCFDAIFLLMASKGPCSAVIKLETTVATSIVAIPTALVDEMDTQIPFLLAKI